jgi:hypothetical protein
MNPLKKGPLREKDRHKWGVGVTHTPLMPSLLLAGIFSSVLPGFLCDFPMESSPYIRLKLIKDDPDIP